jgi:hypothetical protein
MGEFKSVLVEQGQGMRLRIFMIDGHMNYLAARRAGICNQRQCRGRRNGG